MSQPTSGAASSSSPTLLDPHEFLARKSLVELNARERAQALLDEGSYRELLGPFERLESPWLLMQGVVPQADDGLIVARGKIGGKDSVILAIEEQSGIEEFDSKDRQLIWGVNGGEQRHATGFADYLAEDDVGAIKECIIEAFARGIPATHRSEQVDDYLKRLAAIDVSHQLESTEVRKLWSQGKLL